MLSQPDLVTRPIFSTLLEQHQSFIVRQLQQLNQELNADFLYIAGPDEHFIEAKSIVALQKGEVCDNFSYPLADSPCAEVLCDHICSVDDSASSIYPLDKTLKTMEIDAYIGAPILSARGEVIGLIVALFHQPQHSLSRHHFSFTMSASYISAYIEKIFFSAKLGAQINLLSKVEEISQTGAWEYHIAKDKLYWSQQTYRIHGLTENTPLNLDNAIAFYSPESQITISKLVKTLMETGTPYRTELELTDNTGKSKWVRTSGEAEFDATGEVVRVYGAIEDISQEHHLLNNLKHQNTRINSVLNNLNDAVITVNAEGQITHVNSVAERMFGYPQNQMQGMPVEALMPQPYAEKHSHYMANYAQTGKAKIIGTGRQLPGLRRNGEVFQMELSLTKGEYCGAVEYIGIIRDISERLLAQDTIYNLAYTDDITGLKNKRWLEKEFKDLLLRAKSKKHFICAAIIDIDKMAQFNLKYGFKQGNEAIKQIAVNLQQHCDEDTRLYKNGADSFVLLSLQTRPAESAGKMQNTWLKSSFSSPSLYKAVLKEQEVVLSASFGSCVCDSQSHTFESVFDTLEHTLRQAKLHRPFGHYFIDEAGIRAYERIKGLRSSLESITKTGELRLVLQPQYQENGAIPSSEALIRWQSDKMGHVSPAEFIPLAEESAAIIEIGDWVLTQVCRLLQQLNKQGIRTRIAVNISSKQIVLPDFQTKLLTLTQTYQVEPNQIMLELTETTLVSDIELVKNVMLSMRECGFLFSIDDFGTGYSSLNYLKELPISELKIDKHFVDDIDREQNESGGKIVKLIIDMAKILNVSCVAEGVENTEQVAFLRNKSCSLYQGYYFSKPLEISDWLQVMQKQ